VSDEALVVNIIALLRNQLPRQPICNPLILSHQLHPGYREQASQLEDPLWHVRENNIDEVSKFARG
jgi:hypothetical protein